MQPVKPTNPSDKELITQIRQTLLDHEEPYVPGAWERFDDKKKKRRGLVFWIGGLSSAAAGLLLVGGIYFFNKDQTLRPTAEVAVLHQKITDPVEQGGPVAAKMGAHADASVLGSEEKLASGVPNAVNKDKIATVAPGETVVTTGQSTSQFNTIVTTAAVVRSSEPAAVPAPPTIVAAVKPPQQIQKTSFQDFLNKESMKDSKIAVSNPRSEKWEMGVMVAPSFGNTKKLNMGYGVSMAYAVSDKVSFSSGISYNELAASRDVVASTFDAYNPSGFVASESKSLSSVETRVVGIDIPLELKYNISKNIYANVGISAFAVISQQQNNNYVGSRLVQNAGLASDKSNTFTNTLIEEKTTEKAPEGEISQDKYLGFYNFSFGFKQKISKSNSISIEPFMKLPMKEVSKDNFRLMGSGLRLKFDF